MIRIAYLSHQSGVGSEMALVRLLSAIDRSSFDPLVVLAEEGPLRAEIEALSIPIHHMSLAWWIPATHWDAARFLAQLEGLHERATALADWLVAERVGLVHTNSIVNLEGALAAAWLELPHVWHSRGLFGGGFPPAYLDDQTFFLSVVDLLADAIICVSHRVERQAAEICRLALRPVIYDGLNIEHLLARPIAAPDAVRARYGIATSARVIACVGGIQRRKGQLDLVEAAAPLVREFPSVMFVLAGGAGDAEYCAALEARIIALGLDKNILRIGFEPNIQDLLSISEALVHPSHSEGFGLAILEAMAAGVPVVATRCGGPEEIVEDELSGLLVPTATPSKLANALRRILSDPVAARLIGRAGARRVLAFSTVAMARDTECIYRNLLTAPRPGTHVRARLGDFVVDEVLTRSRLALAANRPIRLLPW